jgi:CRISPR-associated endoribonuclease Cas6
MHSQSNELKHLTFARFIFKARALTVLRLPQYKGSTFRGGFGHNLRKTVCINRWKECSGCILCSRCIYTYIFETKPSAGSRTEKSFANVPHPYVLIPPDTEKEIFGPDEAFVFELVLFGRAIEYFPYFLFVFQQLGANGIGKEQGRFYVDSVANERFGSEIEMYNHVTNYLKGETQVYSSENFFHIYKDIAAVNPEEITIRLITPFRLKIDGKLRYDFTFFDFFRNSLNRLYLLTYFHCGNRFDRDHRELLEMSKEITITRKNLRWRDWTRYSNRQKTRMKMGGIVGEFVLRGNLAPFLPFLKIGEFAHVGKATSMGLGRYEVTC